MGSNFSQNLFALTSVQRDEIRAQHSAGDVHQLVAGLASVSPSFSFNDNTPFARAWSPFAALKNI